MQDKLPFIRALAKRFPLITVLASAIAVLASVGIILGAKFNTDVTRLIPAHAPETSLYFDLAEKTGGMDKSYIVFSSDRVMDHAAQIDAIGQEIGSSPMVTKVSWKISEETKTFLREIYARKAPLLLSPAEMEEFVRKLSPEGMEHELEKTRQRLQLPGGQQDLAMHDPLNFFELFLPHMRFSSESFDPGSGYFLTPDKKNLIMILTPAGSPRDIAFSEKFIKSMESLLEKYRDRGLTAEITGSHAITLHEASAMKREIVMNTVSSFASVMLVFLLFFRSLKGLLYVMFPVVTAMIITLGITLLFSDYLSEVTGAFAGMLAGLSDDLGIVLYVRYLIIKEEGINPVEHMDRTITSVYRSITTGTLTTTIIFFPMLFSSFRGIRELGLLTGIGMLLCWLFLFTLASLTIKPSSGRFIEIPALKDLAVFSYRRPFVVIGAVVCSSLVALLFIPRIQFLGDITKLGTDDNRPRQAFERLKDTFIREQGVFITDTSMEMQSALVRSVEIKEALAKDFEHIMAAGDILPPEARQKKNLAALASLDPGKVIRDFKKTASDKGFDIPGFLSFTEALETMLRNREMITLTDVKPVNDLLERLLINRDDQWQIIVSGTLRDGVTLSALDGYKHTGPAFIRQELFSILKKDMTLIGIIGLVMVNIILYLDFRKVYHVLLCQVPVVISILCTLGIMGLTGISLNFMNAIVFVLLFGIGTDYTVHLLHQYHADRDIGSTFLQTGKAVLVAGLTTVAGIGTIGFSTYKGLATMGQVAAIGITLCVFLSFTLVPSLLGVQKARERQ
ncbi:MAG: MMPL family transporter [Nitrospirae bacterium]|nr:MMPL family transporter [Nitrospirota bacterium]